MGKGTPGTPTRSGPAWDRDTQPRGASPARLLPPLPPAPSTQSALLLLAVFYPRKNKRLPPFPPHAGGVKGWQAQITKQLVWDEVVRK